MDVKAKTMVYPVDAASGAARRDGQVRRTALLISLLAPFVFGLLALLLGKDANWDFQNYHFYNPYSWLNNRFDFDVAVSHHATYYNPLIDVPFFMAAKNFPARLAGFLLALVQGLNFVLLFRLSLRVLDATESLLKVWVCAVVALAGMLGGGALGQLGVVSYDNVVSLGVFSSMLLVVSRRQMVFSGSGGKGLFWVFAAGILAGAAVGLKLTAVIYAVGLCLAFLGMPGRPLRRLFLSFFFGVGVLMGMAVFAGPWCLELWQKTGNPLFPQFNSLFQSPYISGAFDRDCTFIPKDPAVRLLFPFYFSADSLRVAEFYFRDVRILCVYVLLPLGLVAWMIRGRIRRDPLSDPVSSRYLLISAVLTYGVWLHLFSIYRYLIALEMLAPLLIALCIDLFPVSRKSRILALVLVLAASQALVRAGFDKRLVWGERYVRVEAPEIAKPQESLVVMTGYAPIAYVIPFFPPEIPFLRIQSWMTGTPEGENRFDLEMRRRVQAHAGDIYVLFAPWELEPTKKALASYGLKMDPDGCKTVRSSVSDALSFCPVGR